ncbi:MAG: hypothetical protein KAH10_07110 [Flavobacteriales bacterium]|nr:hypothetical protein [Flavobacteriales bacterium]
MKKLYLIIFSLFIGVTQIFAQDTVYRERYLQFSTGAKISTLSDKSVSTLHYKGNALAARFAYLDISENLRWWTELEFDGGYSNSYNYPSITDRAANHISGGYNFGIQKPVYKFNDKLNLWLGASLSGRYTYNQFVNYSNSQDNYTFLNNLGVNSLLNYSFMLFDRPWYLEWYMNVPLATYYMRPGYSISYPDGMLGDSGFASFGSFLELDSELRLVFPFKNDNKISLEYHWDYYSLNNDNKVQNSSHAIFLTAYFKLSKKKI